jgi:hypothetical protein
MDWLNIHRSTLGAEEFLGCEPVQRATWLCLMAYCADQENGGRIDGASEWGDRKWQQVVRITRDEAHEKCALWAWVDGVLIVWAYPSEKESEVRRNRENGGKGGRPPKPRNNQVVSSGLPSGLTETITQTEPSAPISAETERKGKERKGKEEEGKEKKARQAAFVPPSEAEWVDYCVKTWPDWHPISAGEAWAYYEALRPPWKGYSDWRKVARTAHGKARDWERLQPKEIVQRPAKPDWVLRKIEDAKSRLATAERQLKRDIADKGADSHSASLSRKLVESIQQEINSL